MRAGLCRLRDLTACWRISAFFRRRKRTNAVSNAPLPHFAVPIINLRKVTSRRREWDWIGAEAAYRQALGLKPNDAHGHRMYASLLSAMERHPEAIQNINERATGPCLWSSTPKRPGSFTWRAYFSRGGSSLADAGDGTAARSGSMPLGLAYQQMGMLETPYRISECADLFHQSSGGSGGACHAYASSGQTPEAEKYTVSWKRGPATGASVSAYWVALMHEGWAMTAARSDASSKRDRDVWLVWLGEEPRFERLRALDDCWEHPAWRTPH